GGFFSVDTKVIAMRSPGEGAFEQYIFFDAVTGLRMGAVPCPPWPSPLVIAPDHQMAAWYNNNGTIQVARVATGNPVCTLGAPHPQWNNNGRTPALAFSSDNRYLATWDRGRSEVLVWDLTT